MQPTIRVKRFIKQNRVHQKTQRISTLVFSIIITWTTELSCTAFYRRSRCACAVGRCLVGTPCAVQWCEPRKEPHENSERKILMLLRAKRSDCFRSGRLKETLKSVKSSNGASHLKRKTPASTLNSATLIVGCDCTERSIGGRGGTIQSHSLHGLSLCF